jgi:hypothetical protein
VTVLAGFPIIDNAVNGVAVCLLCVCVCVGVTGDGTSLWTSKWFHCLGKAVTSRLISSKSACRWLSGRRVQKVTLTTKPLLF